MKTEQRRYSITYNTRLEWKYSKDKVKHLYDPDLEKRKKELQPWSTTTISFIIKLSDEELANGIDFETKLEEKIKKLDKEHQNLYLTKVEQIVKNKKLDVFEPIFSALGEYPILTLDIGKKYYKKYQEMFFIETKKLKELLKDKVLVFNRNGTWIRLYPLNKDGKHLTTINNIPFNNLSKNSKDKNIWNDVKKENEAEILDWRWLQNLDYPEQSENGFNMIGRFFERTEPIYSKLNLVRLSFGDNLDLKWFKGNTPEEVQDRVDQYCLFKNLTAEADVLWPIHKSINNIPFERPFTKEHSEKKSYYKFKYKNKKRKVNNKYYLKYKVPKVKQNHNKYYETERLVCLVEWRNKDHIPANLIEITRVKYSKALSKIEEEPDRFTFTSKSAYKKLQLENIKKYPQHVAKSKLNAKTTLDDETVVKANRRQRRYTEQKKNVKQFTNNIKPKKIRLKSKNNKIKGLYKIKHKKAV